MHRHFVDAGAVSAVIATVLGFLPQLTAVLTFAWACVRLYETETVQKLLRRKRGG